MKLYKIIAHVGGSVAFAAMQWLILVFLSKYVGISEAGSFSYFLAFFTPLAIFCAFNFKSVYSADLSEKYQLIEYESLRTILNLFYISISIIFLISQNDYLLIGLMVFLVKLIEVNADLIYGGWVKKGESQLFGYSKLIKLTLFLIMFYFLYLYGYEKYSYFIYPMAFIFGYLFFDLRLTKVQYKFNWGKVRPIFIGVLPFVLTSFLISFNTSIPRFYLNYFFDKRVVAEFMYLTYFTTIMLLPLTSLYQAILPKIRKHTSKVFKITIIYNLLFIAGFWFLCDFVLEKIYNYYGVISNDIKILIMMSMVTQTLVVFVNMLYVSSMKFNKIFKVTLMNTFIVAILNFIFIKFFGYVGVYYASVISSFLLLANLCVNYLKDKVNEV